MIELFYALILFVGSVFTFSISFVISYAAFSHFTWKDKSVESIVISSVSVFVFMYLYVWVMIE